MTAQNLELLLQYKNPHVLERYTRDYPMNKLEAEEAFQELLKFFWLSQKHRLDVKDSVNSELLDFTNAMHEEMSEIDDMWHTFILFTKDYADFCQHYFGQFIHHQPTTDDEKINSKEQYQKELENYASYIYDNLGEATLRKWFNEYD